MQSDLDRASPVPLYHQIAEALRYRIATARLRPGESLPPVRDAARTWQVNLHTVRRAYRELADAGLLEIRPPHAARVIAPPRRDGARGRKIDRLLDSIESAARKQGVATAELAALLLDRSTGGARPGGLVHVLECSEIQAAAHAQEIETAWDVRAEPWSLEREGEPPPGPAVGTYFHYNDIRVRWPHRLGAVRFAGIQPDPSLPRRLAPHRGVRRRTVYLWELDLPLAQSVAADLTLLLPPERYRIVPEVVRKPGRRLAEIGKRTVLLPPRVWNLLSESQREDPRAIEVPYVFEPSELDALGRHFRWRKRR